MRITESQLRQIVREEARRVLRESHPTADDIIDRYKSGSKRDWMWVSNDFHAMVDGDEEGLAMARKYYPGLNQDDFGRIAATLDAHFGMG